MNMNNPYFNCIPKFRLKADGEMTGQILLSYFVIYNKFLFWMKMIAKAHFVIVVDRYDSFIIY